MRFLVSPRRFFRLAGAAQGSVLALRTLRNIRRLATEAREIPFVAAWIFPSSIKQLLN